MTIVSPSTVFLTHCSVLSLVSDLTTQMRGIAGHLPCLPAIPMHVKLVVPVLGILTIILRRGEPPPGAIRIHGHRVQPHPLGVCVRVRITKFLEHHRFVVLTG